VAHETLYMVGLCRNECVSLGWSDVWVDNMLGNNMLYSVIKTKVTRRTWNGDTASHYHMCLAFIWHTSVRRDVKTVLAE
jgi:hypothetical protein